MPPVLYLLLLLLTLAQCTPECMPLNKTVANTQTWLGSPSQLSSCYLSLPFDEDIVNKTMSALMAIPDIYSFTDIVADSGPPYDLAVDLKRDLKGIQAKVRSGVYTSDFLFHDDARALFLRLRDAHTRYDMPLGYNAFLLKPFSLMPKLDDGTLRFYVAEPGLLNLGEDEKESIADIFVRLASFDVTQYIGLEVSKINGVPIYDSLIEFANDHVGLYKDLQVRLNALLRKGGFWQIINVRRYGLDFPDSYNFTFLEQGNEHMVTVPHVAASGIGPITVEKILSENEYKPPPPLKGKQMLSENPVDIQKELENEVSGLSNLINKKITNKYYEETTPKDPREQNDIQVIYGSVEDQVMYMLVNNSMPVLKLLSFAPNLTIFAEVITNSSKHFRKNNYTDLTIDVSRNGGGYICLAYDMLGSLVTSWTNYTRKYSSAVWSVYDRRFSPIVDTIVDSPIGFKSENINFGYPNTRFQWPDGRWMDPVEFKRGGRIGFYTQKSYFPYECGNDVVNPLDPDRWPESTVPFFSPKLDKIIAVTDGTCGSACSLFLTKLMHYEKGFVVSYGGDPSIGMMETSSFAGGNVVAWNEFYDNLKIFGLDSKFPEFGHLPTSALLRYNQHETYVDIDSTIPREFVRLTTKFHIDNYEAVVNDKPFLDDGSVNYGVLDLYSSAFEYFSQIPGGQPGHVEPWIPPTTTTGSATTGQASTTGQATSTGTATTGNAVTTSTGQATTGQAGTTGNAATTSGQATTSTGQATTGQATTGQAVTTGTAATTSGQAVTTSTGTATTGNAVTTSTGQATTGTATTGTTTGGTSEAPIDDVWIWSLIVAGGCAAAIIIVVVILLYSNRNQNTPKYAPII